MLLGMGKRDTAWLKAFVEQILTSQEHVHGGSSSNHTHYKLDLACTCMILCLYSYGQNIHQQFNMLVVEMGNRVIAYKLM